MEIKFDFELDDWIEFQKNHLKNSKNFKKTKIISILLVPTIFVIMVLMDYLKNDFKISSAFIFGIASLFWIIFYPKSFEKRTLEKSKKMILEGDNSGTIGEHKIVFTDDEIIHIEPGSEHKLKWKSIKKINETDQYYFLYLTSISAIVIPKNKITDKITELNLIIKKNFAQQLI